jgi:hypothetical protein
MDEYEPVSGKQPIAWRLEVFYEDDITDGGVKMHSEVSHDCYEEGNLSMNSDSAGSIIKVPPSFTQTMTTSKNIINAV